jgi:hypothetical protein
VKLLGHVYVATKAFPKKDKELLTLGAILPELVFYIKHPVFKYEQFHEGGLDLYKYLTKNKKEFTDIAIGILAHSEKYGADRFNTIFKLFEIGLEESDIDEIAQALGISEKRAEIRAHNMYGLAIEYYLAKSNPEILKLIKNVKLIDQKEISIILSKYFKTDPKKTLENMNHIWKIYDLRLVNSFSGLATLWKRLAQNFIERNTMDLKKTASVIETIYLKTKSKIPAFLNKVTKETRNNILQAIRTTR